MAAVVPSRDPVAAKRALNQVRQDKRREVGDGFDGSWVATPAWSRPAARSSTSG
jgi:malate synthase